MNHLTLEELATKLAEVYDEISILEMLEINSFDLVERFKDKIEEKYDILLDVFWEELEEAMDGEQEI